MCGNVCMSVFCVGVWCDDGVCDVVDVVDDVMCVCV